MASAVAPTVPRSASSRRIRSRLKSMSRGYTAGLPAGPAGRAGQPARPDVTSSIGNHASWAEYGQKGSAMDWIVWLIVIIVIVAVVWWLLNRTRAARAEIPHPPGRPAPAIASGSSRRFRRRRLGAPRRSAARRRFGGGRRLAAAARSARRTARPPAPEAPPRSRSGRYRTQAAAAGAGCTRAGQPSRPRRSSRAPRPPGSSGRPGQAEWETQWSETAAPRGYRIRCGPRMNRLAGHAWLPERQPRGSPAPPSSSRESAQSRLGPARPPPRIHRAPRADPVPARNRPPPSQPAADGNEQIASPANPGLREPRPSPAGHLATEQPYGEGSAAPAADGSGPEGFTVKGNASSMIYHDETSPAYEETRAEVWFASAAHAEAAGFRPPRRTRL